MPYTAIELAELDALITTLEDAWTREARTNQAAACDTLEMSGAETDGWWGE